MNMVTLTESIILRDVLPTDKFFRLHDDLRRGWVFGNNSNDTDTYESWSKKYDSVG